MTMRPLSAFLTRLIWLCMAPLLLLAVWLAWDNLHEQEARHLNEGADEAQNFAITIDQHLRARINALHMLAVSPLADDPRRWPELYVEAQGFRESFDLHVIFADSDRQMLFNTRQPYGAKLPRLPDSKGKTAAPLALETGQPQVGDIVFGPVAKIPLVAIAVPVLREAKPTRLMLSIFETAQFQRRLDLLALPAGWSIALLDGTGADIARRSPPGFDSARDVDADHRFVVRSKLSPWSVVLEIPRSSHWDNQLRSLLFLIAAIVLATLLGLIGGTLAGSRLRRQVAMLLAPSGADSTPDIAEIATAQRTLAESASARQASEARFSRLFHEAPVPLCFVNKEGVLADRNRRFDQVFGYGHDELRTLDDWWPLAYPDPAYRARVLDTWNAAVAAAGKDGTDIVPIEYDITCKGGSRHTMLVSGITLGEDFLATFFDVTEHSKATRALKEARLAALNRMEDANAARAEAERQSTALRDSQERLQLFIDHAPAALAMFDREMRYLAVSRRWREDYFLGERPLIGHSHYEIFPEIPERWKEIHRRGMAGEIICADEDRFERLDGSVQWLRWEVRPWHAHDGTVGGIVVFSEDITRLVDANRTIRTGAERVKLLAEVVERIASVHDLPSLMEVVRPAVRLLTGADGATLVLNDNGYCFYADEDAIGPLWKGQRFPLESCISGWVMLHGEAAVIEDIYADERIPHEAYRPTFVKSLVMVPVGRNGPVAAIGAYWATQHKASAEEVELQQTLADAMSVGLANIDLIQNLERRVEERTAELAAANRELESFAYAVSHDLRAPLRAMSGFSQALEEDYGGQLAGEAKTYLDQIGIASRRMTELIDGILTLSRSTRGELRRDAVDLSALAGRRLDELARLEPGRQVAVEVEDGLVARGDARMLEAVVTNLIDNAWKYTGRTEVPAIRFGRSEVDGREGFCIADNGAGFDPAHAGRLFKPFQRLHRQDEFPGIGIGLATVQRIIHRHGGEIVATAVPGKGATFCFTLPENAGRPDKETPS
ncbi:MAG: PAS domain S-box protein [Azospira sp.]|jgi:PAS domain S-box-containing protein|nr:PAS domain S-box protein [Azospira sp.]